MTRTSLFPGLLAGTAMVALAAAADAGSAPAPAPATSKTQGIRIQGFDFTVGAPYGVGHVLTEAEASNLNQVFGENIRNNVATKIKSAKEKFIEAGGKAEAFTLDIAIDQGEGKPTKTLRQLCQEYADSYEFGVRTARVAEPVDPVEREAKRIATDMVKSALATKNVKIKDLKEGQFDEMVAKVGLKPEVVKEAQRRVKAKEGIGLDELGLDLGDAGASTEAAPASDATAA